MRPVELRQRTMTKIWNQLRQRPLLLATLLLTALALLFLNTALFPPAGQVLGGADMRGYYYPFFDAVHTALRDGRFPVWEPYLFNGYPLMAQPQQNAFYPLGWIFVLLPTTVGISWYMLLHIVLAGVGMFAFVRYLGARWLPSMLAAIAFAFSGLLAGRMWAGHSTVYAVDAWTPWLLLALAWSVRRGGVWTAVLAGVPFGMAILAGHIPSFLYVGMIWGAFALYLLLTEKTRRWLVVRQAAIMLAVGLALAAVQLAPFAEFSVTSGRVAEADYEFATNYSLPPAHLITLIVPEFFGEPTRVGYWSVPTFEELTYYAGLLALLGIALALRRPTRLTWFYLLLAVFGLLLALGRYGVLYPLAYDLLPPFRIVRAPGRAAFLYLFAATALLAHAMSHWQAMPLAERRAKLGRTWRWVLAVVTVAGLAALAATGAVFMAIHPTDTSGRLWHQLGGYAIALGGLLLGGGLLWSFLMTPSQQRRRRTLLGAALIVVVVVDVWLFALKFVRLEPVSPDAIWLDAKEVIGTTTGRVLPWGVTLFEQNGAMQVGLYSVFGYDSLEPADHVALAASVPDPRSTAYDVLGVRYVVAPTALDQFTEGERPLTLLAQNDTAWVYERARVLPVARLVYDAEIIADNAATVARIHQPDFDPETTAILPAAPPCELGPAPAAPGTAEIVRTAPGLWEIRTASDAPGLLLLAATAYPGWQVTIDGQVAQALEAYTTVRAVCVPAGEHTVLWRYVPTIYWLGGGVTAAALLLALIALIALRRQPRA